jgi:hypothetical protein
MKYIKKPIPVEAFCPNLESWPEWFKNNDKVSVDIIEGQTVISIETLEGIMKCNKQDYIIQGVDGELYPCRRDIFLKTYEKFEEGN